LLISSVIEPFFVFNRFKGSCQILRIKPGIESEIPETILRNHGVCPQAVIAAITTVRADTAQMIAFRLNHIGSAFLATAAHQAGLLSEHNRSIIADSGSAGKMRYFAPAGAGQNVKKDCA
jgi:hypothetical protein